MDPTRLPWDPWECLMLVHTVSFPLVIEAPLSPNKVNAYNKVLFTGFSYDNILWSKVCKPNSKADVKKLCLSGRKKKQHQYTLAVFPQPDCTMPGPVSEVNMARFHLETQ